MDERNKLQIKTSVVLITVKLFIKYLNDVKLCHFDLKKISCYS